MHDRGTLGLFCRGSAGALALWLATTPAPAAAQQMRSFDIPAGALGAALTKFAHQANQEIVFSSTLVVGKRTAGVHGQFEPRAAVSVLLQGTGLQITPGQGSVITVRNAGDPQEARAQAGPYEPDNSHALERASYAEAAPLAPAAAAPLAAVAEAAQPAPSQEEIVVTGSHIVRNGYQAPTPTTILSADDIQLRDPSNIADYLNLLPQFGLATSPRTTTLSAGTTGGGANNLNLRGLGTTRTLVLLDGRRVVSDGINSTVDINLLPSNLVKRVDVVTGGASAAYGSDAVAGVVNFILDTDFTGAKGTVNYGVTDMGDAQSVQSDIAVGAKLFGGRGHVLFSAQYYDGDGVDTPEGRDWYQPGYHLISNPAWTATNGQPGQIVRYDVGWANATEGGLITTGPLKGTVFGPQGAIGQFAYGSIQNGNLQAGGTVAPTANIWPLLPAEKNWSTFAHFNYDLTNNIRAIFEFNWAGSDASNWSSQYSRYGDLTITRDNPYLPLQIQQEMASNNITSFKMGRLNYDLVEQPDGHGGEAGYSRRQTRYLVALEGSFLKTGKWNAYYQHGDSDVWYTRSNNPIVSRYNQAIDVVANPATGGVSGVPVGQPVCRSTLTAPTNGCLPLDIFGVGMMNQTAIDWVLDKGHQARQDLSISQDVWSIDGQYEPFSTWAGPVSVAGGFQWRKEQFNASADALSLQAAWFTGNFAASHGEYTVSEFFGETLVPLVHNLPFFKEVDFNGAVRRTDYSTSGTVTTWKGGLTWDLNDELRLRTTRSRDIRAPNLNDLYAAGTAYQNSYRDPSQPGSPLVSTWSISGGNPNLKPEEASTFTAGVIYRPLWLRGFSGSIDFYKIKIKDAIVSIDAQTLINQCYGAGIPQITSSCASIVKAPGSNDLVNATIYTGGVNAQNQEVDGVDYEFGYRTSLDRLYSPLVGSADLRLVASQKMKDQTALGGTVTNSLDLSGHLKWSGMLVGTYALGPSRTTLTLRYLGPGRVSDYPSTNTSGVPANLNHIDSVIYTDLAENYDVDLFGRRVTLFGVIENLFDKDPPPVPGSYSTFGSTTQYDLIGRMFRIGARAKF